MIHGDELAVIAVGGFSKPARFVAAHVTLVSSIWLSSILLYSFLFSSGCNLGVVVIDLALVGGCLLCLHRYREHLGFSSLGEHRARKIVITVIVSVLCVGISQFVVADQHGIWIDESNYLATVRAGRILTDGLYPFNARSLEPFLAGRWNIIPVNDAEALKAINFGALIVTAVLLVHLLVRVRVRYAMALGSPVVLASSYLGVYASVNRLVLDPFN